MSASNQSGYKAVVQDSRYSVLCIESTSTNYKVNGFLLVVRERYLLVSCWKGLEGIDMCELKDSPLQLELPTPDGLWKTALGEDNARCVVSDEQLGVVMIELSPRLVRHWKSKGMHFLEPCLRVHPEEANGAATPYIVWFHPVKKSVLVGSGELLDCTSFETEATGASSGGYLFHTMHTEDGSSGAPVLTAEGVLGVHLEVNSNHPTLKRARNIQDALQVFFEEDDWSTTTSSRSQLKEKTHAFPGSTNGYIPRMVPRSQQRGAAAFPS